MCFDLRAEKSRLAAPAGLSQTQKGAGWRALEQFQFHFFGRTTNNSWPYSIGCPLLASFFTISPATSDSISFNNFIASTIHSTCPNSTVSPTLTKGGAPGEGAS